MHNVLKAGIISIFIVFFFICTPLSVYSDETAKFKTSYDVRYTPHLNGDSDVDLSITIVNLQSDVYVREFSLSFPSAFAMSAVTAKDDYGRITPMIEYEKKYNKITLSFSNPAAGKNSVNHATLHFLQKNLFKTEGNIWEVILPTINNTPNTVYNIQVTLPEKNQHTVSIAKPKPSYISGNTIFWKDVKTRTVYAVFGDRQYYTFTIIYSLKNDELHPVYYDIALPPETAYQKVIINALKPEPEKIYFDEDDNILARYTLSIKEQKKIILDGSVTVFVYPQEKIQKRATQNISIQKKYLLDNKSYWDIGEKQKGDNRAILNSAEDIYRYVTSTLTYNYSRISNNIPRLGAASILEKPDQAVCMEFTDLFIALARQKGILTREIEGYAFSDDRNLRPLSLISDILHAWPEYYDEKSNWWIPIDPTWENTSGIDYFSAFDLNHIVFAIHGKDPSYPLPAGMYKISDSSKDIKITPSATKPREEIKIKIIADINKNITDNHTYKTTIQIKNIGSVFLRNAAIELQSNGLIIKPHNTIIDVLAPYQTKELSFTYRAHLVTKKTNATITIVMNKKSIHAISLTVSSFYQDIFYKSIGIMIGIVVCLFGYFVINRRVKKL